MAQREEFPEELKACYTCANRATSNPDRVCNVHPEAVGYNFPFGFNVNSGHCREWRRAK